MFLSWCLGLLGLWLVLVACWLRVGTSDLASRIHCAFHGIPVGSPRRPGSWLMFRRAYLTCYWPEPDWSSDVRLVLYSCNIWWYIRSWCALSHCRPDSVACCTSGWRLWICSVAQVLVLRVFLLHWKHPEVWSWTQTQCQLPSATCIKHSGSWVILNCFSCIDNDMCMPWHCHSCPSLASTFLGSRSLTVRCVIAAMVICALSHVVVREYLAAGGVDLTENQVQRMLGSAPVKLCGGLIHSFLIFQKPMSGFQGLWWYMCVCHINSICQCETTICQFEMAKSWHLPTCHCCAFHADC